MTSYNEIITISALQQQGLDIQQATAVEKWVRNYCHNLFNKTLNYDDNIENEYILQYMSDVITHNVVKLVAEWKNTVKMQNLLGGTTVVSQTANPYRQNNIDGKNKAVINNQQFTYNEYDTIQKQQTIINKSITALKEIYDELQQMVVKYH